MKSKVSLTTQNFELEANQDEIETFLGAIVPKSLKNLSGGLFGDRIAEWRVKRLVQSIARVKVTLDSNDINAREVPLKTLFPIFEGISLEDDADLTDKWENLLTNAISGQNIPPSYAEILKEISPIEAKILDAIFHEASMNQDVKARTTMQFSRDAIGQAFNVGAQEMEIIIENLYRLNLCRQPASHNGVSLGQYPISMTTTEIFELTRYGYDFVRACKSST